FLLYGMALIYGATGATTLHGIAQFVGASGSSVLLLVGIGFLVVGLAFKASAAPFHMWTPDVYQGAPTVVTTFMSVATKAAAFAVVTAVETRVGEGGTEIPAWTGLFYRQPLLATTMTVFMLSLAGIPPTVGFFAKLFVFRPLVEAQLWAPLAVAIVTTVISFYYYLRVVVVMLTAPEEAGRPAREPVSRVMGAILVFCSIATIVLGVF